MFIRGSPPPSHNTNNHCVSLRKHCVVQFPCKKLLESNFQSPMFVRGSPYKSTHISTVWPHTTIVYTGKQLPRRHVYEGFPLYNTHYHCVGTHNHSVHYWKATFRTPCLYGVPPVKQHTFPLYGHSQPLCTLLENNFQGRMFIRGSPYKITHITTVWALTQPL